MWRYSICDDILYVTIFYMWRYSICDDILYVTIFYMWRYSICDDILYVTIFYMWRYSICDDILYVELKFIILILCMLLTVFLYKRHQISGPKKRWEINLFEEYMIGYLFIYLLQLGFNSEDLYKIRKQTA